MAYEIVGSLLSAMTRTATATSSVSRTSNHHRLTIAAAVDARVLWFDTDSRLAFASIVCRALSAGLQRLPSSLTGTVIALPVTLISPATGS
jgi:hypothetical protein